MTSTTSAVDSECFSFEMPPTNCLSFEWASPDTISTLSPERRERHRRIIRAQARICVDGLESLDAHAIDLSPHGLAVTSTRPLNVDQECTVELGISTPEIARSPALRASVRYCARLRDDQFRIGMKFIAVSIEAAELLVAVLEL